MATAGASRSAQSRAGRTSWDLAHAAGFDVPADTTLLVVDPDALEPDPLVTECLAPLLATVSVPTFDAGLSTTARLLARKGAGHSVAVHTTDREAALQAGWRRDGWWVVINQPNLASSGAVGNGLAHSLSMGGGTWAGTQFAETLSYRQSIQTTRVACPVDADDPGEAADLTGMNRWDFRGLLVERGVQLPTGSRDIDGAVAEAEGAVGRSEDA